MDRVLSAVHQASSSANPIKLLFAALDTRVGIFLDVPDCLVPLVKKQLYGEFPGLAIDTLPSDTFQPSVDEQSHSASLTLRPDLYPIQRYCELHDRTDQSFADPLTAILEAVAADPETMDRTIVELTITPTSWLRKWWAAWDTSRLARSHFNISPMKTRLYAFGVTSRHVLVRCLIRCWGLFAAGHRAHAGASQLSQSATREGERQNDLTAAKEKIGSFLFTARLRVIRHRPTTYLPKENAKLKLVASVVAATANPRLATFQVSSVRKLTSNSTRQRDRGFLLSTEELATIFHPATVSVAAANMNAVSARQTEPPSTLPTEDDHDGVPLGHAHYRSNYDHFYLRRIDRRRHVYIPGKTGMGKTTLMQNMMKHDIFAGRGIAYLDPHGDAVSELARSVPLERQRDLVILDPSDRDFPVALNPLDTTGLDETQRALLASGMLQVVKTLFAESFNAAARMEDLFRNAFLALAEVPGTTLLSLPMMLRDEAFRTSIAQMVNNPVVRNFWLEQYPSWDNRYRKEAISPVENKLRAFLSNPILQAILTQRKNKVNLRKIMDEQKILLVNLSKGKIGDDPSSFLGSVLVTMIQTAAMSRAEIAEHQRRDFYLYVDEFQNFINDSFADILSEARKYRLNLTIANQYLAQTVLGKSSKVKDAIFGNVGTIISFAVGKDDAEYLTEQFHTDLQPSDFVHLPKYHAYVALMIDGQTSDPFLMTTLEPTKPLHGDKTYRAMLNVSRNIYATPATEANNALEEQLAFA